MKTFLNNPFWFLFIECYLILYVTAFTIFFQAETTKPKTYNVCNIMNCNVLWNYEVLWLFVTVNMHHNNKHVTIEIYRTVIMYMYTKTL